MMAFSATKHDVHANIKPGTSASSVSSYGSLGYSSRVRFYILLHSLFCLRVFFSFLKAYYFKNCQDKHEKSDLKRSLYPKIIVTNNFSVKQVYDPYGLGSLARSRIKKRPQLSESEDGDHSVVSGSGMTGGGMSHGAPPTSLSRQDSKTWTLDYR